ncbi:hypothetical protein ACGFMM_12310 [Streptomyces sp. NPDC048604]|uniref:hypothetical protein n=1 Tax=Streptomyces sp. NPDC048604 TaxID=3365578 RepID=UPI00371AAFE1
MSEPNPYRSDPGYQWGPGQQPGAPGYGYPGPAYGYPQYAPAVAPTLQIGDISVVGDQIVTPSGTMPLKGAVWNAMDLSRVEEKIPPVAIVLAVIFFLACLLGLLFLLMKERITTGYVQVTVTSGGRHHSVLIPATTPDTFFGVMGQINYARTLSI